MPHGFGPPPRLTAKVASAAIAKIIKESLKEVVIGQEAKRQLASIYFKAAKCVISSQMLDQHIKEPGRTLR